MVGAGCSDIPGQQLFDAVDGMGGEAREHVAQVLFGVKVVEFRRADQGVEGCGTFATLIGAGKKIIFAVMEALS